MERIAAFLLIFITAVAWFKVGQASVSPDIRYEILPQSLGWTYCDSTDTPRSAIADEVFDSEDPGLLVEVVAHETAHRQRAEGHCSATMDSTAVPRWHAEFEAAAYCAGIVAADAEGPGYVRRRARNLNAFFSDISRVGYTLPSADALLTKAGCGPSESDLDKLAQP